MLSFLMPVLKRDFKNYYPSKWSIPTNIIVEIGTLFFLYFTSKAFIPKTELFGTSTTDYFSFILIGDLCFRLPSLFIMSFTRILKNYGIEGAIDHFLLIPGSINSKFLKEVQGILVFEFLKILFIFAIATTFFGLSFSTTQLGLFFSMQIASVPFFIGLGYLSAAIFLKWKRGESIVGKATSLAVVLSGAYFPTNVFPNFLSSILGIVSPFNYLMSNTRMILTGSFSFPELVINLLNMVGVGFIIYLSAIYFLNKSVDSYRAEGKPLFFAA